MSFFNNLLTGPLYSPISEIDETGNSIPGTVSIIEVWGAFSDGTLIYKDDSSEPSVLRYLRIGDEPGLYIHKIDAEKALEELEARNDL